LVYKGKICEAKTHFFLYVTTGNGLFADGREVCRWPENKPSAHHRICRWQSRAIGKDILPTVQTSAKTGHRQSRSLPTAKPSANPSHRQILIFADGQAIGNVRPSAKLAQGRRRPTPCPLPMALPSGRRQKGRLCRRPRPSA